MKTLRILKSSLRTVSIPRTTLIPAQPSIRRQSNSPNPPSQNPPQPKSQSEAQTLIQEKRAAQQNRTAIDRQSYEYSNSGTDDAVASQPSSYAPTNPQDAIAHAAEELQNISVTTTANSNQSPAPPPNAGFNPLEVSPANVEVSGTTSEREGSAGAGCVPHGEQIPSQTKAYMGSATMKSKTKVSTTSEKVKVTAGADLRREARPGAEQFEMEEERTMGRSPRPGKR